MMAGEDGVGEIIEPHLTSQAPVALSVPLPLVVAMTCYLVAPALRTPSGQRRCRTASKHLASSTRDWMLTKLSIAAGSFPLVTTVARDERPSRSCTRSSQQAEAIIGGPAARPSPQNAS